ncbi:hypothetical protein L3Q82_017141 [Scortum barcoo]|uniref:Uncharacterized protein n=1 Tax=Scortum barcoo TaxID=214431 RepID=A0ACB8X8T8_9TELE|nr:hypothetical protein L3Q82_017141 [Scortum barcoo]
MASFYRIDSESSRLPSMLSALEEQNFLFQLQLQDKAEEDSSEKFRRNSRELRGQSLCFRGAPAGDGDSGIQPQHRTNHQQAQKADQIRELRRCGAGRPRKNLHFDLLDSVLGDRPACQLTGALNSATAMLEDMVDDSIQSSADPQLSAIEDIDDADQGLPPPRQCTSPAPSTVSSSSTRRGFGSFIGGYVTVVPSNTAFHKLLLIAQYPFGSSSAVDDSFLSQYCEASGALLAHSGGQQDCRMGAVVCHSPVNHLGQCRKGSTLSFAVAFQTLRTGLFELSQHMKLKLQFTASVSTPPGEPRSPLRNSPSLPSPAVRELLERHNPSRCQSFSNQYPSKSHHVRSGSMTEHQVIICPEGLSVGRTLYLPPDDNNLISLDKIAKRECKVLVLEALQDAHSR